jgi:LemA protein
MIFNAEGSGIYHIIFFIIIVAVGLWVMLLFNRVVSARQLLREAWSGIDVQLKRRFDLLPNLVETVKGYSAHESEVLETVASLRSDGSADRPTPERAVTENQLTTGIKSLFALAEAYPQLKADAQYLKLQQTLTDVEEQIQYARRYYNGTVRNYNILIQSFPNNLLAGCWHYQPEDYFEIELATQREAPGIAFSA